MDPFLDEKLIAILSKSCSDYIAKQLQVSAEREAYGPSKNEGLCYESCQSVDLLGEVEGKIYFGMDGYTRLKLLPRMADKIHQESDLKGMVDSLLMEFANQMGAEIVNELHANQFDSDLGVPESLNNKLVKVDLNRYRQYIIIFFIRDRRAHEYLGRIYVVFIVRKF
ncbi:MAG: chemotaxis protein CheX [Spirochaetia bacterium]|nr:chemotaxis protein CheX [Spirochaetia bacterium]